MEVSKELITKLADDVWAVAKSLEDRPGRYSEDYESYNDNLITDLKTISGCLHDIMAGRKTKWVISQSIKWADVRM